MTRSGDERKSDASNDDDDLGLDESLSSMRSMWRDMRDEEPSDKGMAALLAAAREKAEEMKPKRSWLAVLLDQLRRPPVLAMATVVVLIGGAVVISQRKDEIRTESELAESSSDTRGDTVVATPEPAPAPAAEPVVTETEPPGAEVRDRGGQAAGSAAPGPVAAPVVAEKPRPPAKKATRPSAGEGGALDNLAKTPDAPKLDAAKAEKKQEPREPLQLATGDEDDMQPKGAAESTGAAPPAPAPVSRKPLPSIEGEDRTSRDTTLAQLVKQCEAAAAKNDCGAVRTIVQKIQRQDPSTYRLKLAKNAAVTRCLEPPAPVEAAPEANAD
ncbi:MAG: hypothetical protein AB7T06_04870 [Kofleriaceae bacterium]